MQPLNLYNTLTRKKEEFKPLNPPEVDMYVCGITPYSEAHLGHARCYVVFDTLRRYLEFKGYKVKYIQNITDIDDKIINKSREENLTPGEISEKYFSSFMENMKRLNVMEADFYPRVTGTIEDIIKFIEELIRKDSAYEKNGSVYFRVSSIEDYGRLSGRKANELLSAQERAGEKEDPRDFAVWKADEEFGWDSPWGKGRPGWHIECSAMSRKYLGDVFDIHGGGLDLIFPHHENEVAQTKALTGKEPVRFWIHNGMVTLRGDKMAKSTGHYFLLKDILAEYHPMVVRLFLLSSGYRQALDFNPEALSDTLKAYNKLVELKKELKKLLSENTQIKPVFPEKVTLALDDDLNTAKALGEIFKAANPVMKRIYNGTQSGDDLSAGLGLIDIMENVFGVLLSEAGEVDEKKIEDLIARRQEFRKEKNFAAADEIRDKLEEMGIEVKDTPAGPRWFYKKT